jgi:hypothetical protein
VYSLEELLGMNKLDKLPLSIEVNNFDEASESLQGDIMNGINLSDTFYKDTLIIKTL